jgi:hypothetical protein
MLEKMKAGIVKITTRKQPAPEHTAPISTYGKIANLAEPNFREYSTSHQLVSLHLLTARSWAY